MNSRKISIGKKPGIAWLLIPAVWVVAALAGLVLTQRPSLLADQLPPAPGSAGPSTVEAAPYVTSDLSVPSASTVFKDHSPQASEHVDQF